MTQWDATSLITCAKFQMDGRLVLDYALDAARIVVTTEVQQETVQAGLAGGYPDAVEIKARGDINGRQRANHLRGCPETNI